MRGAIPPLPQYVFMVWWLVKHRDNFTFTFISLYYISVLVQADRASIRQVAVTNSPEKHVYILLHDADYVSQDKGSYTSPMVQGTANMYKKMPSY
jgi:hypothetical protein